MYKYLLLLFVLVGGIQQTSYSGPAYAYRIKFKDKNGTLTFADSLSFLSQKALTRRANQGIMLDSSDLPVVKAYIDTVMTVTNAHNLHNVSKWFNQIVVITFDSLKGLDAANLPMVEKVQLVARYQSGIFKTDATVPHFKFPKEEEISNKTTGTSAFYGLSFQQVDMLEADCLHDAGFMGEGMDIAVFDANFRRVDSCSLFDSIRLNNRIKDVHSFVKDTPFVYSLAINNGHGTNVLSCMAGYIPTNYVGTSPNANYYLYITEDVASEQPIEEDNWLSAAERSDSIGVWLVNSSLGYNIYDALFSTMSYSYPDLTGRKTLIAQALNKLASKGVLIVQAQGNEGASAWHYLLTPADADSAYSVGSVDGSGIWGGSGYGPNYSGLTKPDGVALGKATLIGGSGVGCVLNASNGSSFASPIMCGAIACLWQALPNKTSWQIRQLVRMSSDRYTLPNNTVGFGMPNFCNAYNIALGVSDVQNIDYSFALYPNPTLGSFEVQSFDSRIKDFTYSLYDISGKCVFKSNEKYTQSFRSNALESLPAGQYVLLISSAEKTFSTKVIKN